ncbi:MAG: indolepyruvate ferredoxin oxidoreductase, alpha subunit [Archaeoglobi archaeon]|nr:indolepyruvate ferredoxin oxidoreductase, alpha subunit [Archaeoglobi archaeon]
MLGNHAIARGAIEAGVNFAAGYPGTPSSEIIEALSRERDIYVEWSVNEKVALENCIGASWCGARAMATMKHVGLNVASDALMTLAYTGVRGGLVIISADDPYAHSSQNEQDSRRYAYFAKLPCLEPSNPQEAKDMTKEAFRLSEELELPVIVRPTTRVCHSKSDVLIEDIERREIEFKFEKDVKRFVMVPAHARERHKVLLKKYEESKSKVEKWNLIEEGGSFGIIASGVAWAYAREACERLKINPTFLKIGAHPISEEVIERMLERCDKILVVEEVDPVIEERVLQLNRGDSEVFGKISGHLPAYGEYDVDIVGRAIASILGMKWKEERGEIELTAPPRPPILCAGCPHRASFYAMKKVFGENAVYSGDIGCYTLGYQMGAIDTTLCMGSSITIGSGMSHVTSQPVVCIIGDSTFIHAGITGLVNAVYNRSNITLVILDNDTTAMTGHQPHPSTGKTAKGEETVSISLEDIARACGVQDIHIVDPYDLKETMEAFEKAKNFEGVSLVICRQSCVIDARRRGVKRGLFEVDAERCVGCRKCLELECPAIEFDERASINFLCTGCGVCAQICPVGAIQEVRE